MAQTFSAGSGTWKVFSIFSAISSRDSFLFQDVPHFPRSNRHVDMLDAEVREGIHDRVHKSRGRTHVRRLANSLGPERVMRRRRAGFVRLPMRSFDGCGKQVVHKAAALHVAVLVVVNLLHKGDAQTLGEAPVNLAVDDHGVYDVAAIIHCHEAPHLDFAGALVDIHHANVSAERESKIRRIVIVDCFEASLETRGNIGVRGEGDLLNRLRFAGLTLDVELPRLPLQIVFTTLQQVCPIPAPRSEHTLSRVPGPGSWYPCAPWPCRWDGRESRNCRTS